MKKYILMERDTIQVGNVTLYRIKALRAIHPATGVVVPAHTQGGYVQSEKNLSQDGECWIFDDAKVMGKACVSGSAIVRDNALLCQRAQAFDNAVIGGQATLKDCAKASGYAQVIDKQLGGVDHVRTEKLEAA